MACGIPVSRVMAGLALNQNNPEAILMVNAIRVVLKK
jgi:hypothetical protein